MKFYFQFMSLLLSAALISACAGKTETDSAEASSNIDNTDNTAIAKMEVSQASLSFGTVTTGSSTSQTITVSNTGTAKLTLGSMTPLSAPFSYTGGTCVNNMELNSNDNCTITIGFAPTAAGAMNSSFNISSNDSVTTTNKLTVLVSLSGTGGVTTPNTPNINVSSTVFSFGSVNVGSNSSQTITVSNNGTASLTLGTLTSPSAPFSRTGGTCTNSLALASNASCTIILRYAPTSAGAASGSFSIPSNDPDAGTANGENSLQIGLSGTGVATTPNINVSSTSVSFGSVAVGSNSSQTITVSNTGTASLTLGTLTSPSAPFSRTGGTCTNSLALASNASCTIILRYAPTSAGAASGSFSIPSNDPNAGTANAQNNVLVNLNGYTPTELATLSCAPPAPAGGTGDIFYVAPDANAASCAQVATHNSIASALAAAGPDDVVRLLPGTFNESVNFPHGGTNGHPITLTYTPTNVCANGGEHTALVNCASSGNVNCVDASYSNLIIDGLEVSNAAYNGIKVDGDANGSPTSYPADSAYGYYSYGYYAGDVDYWGNIRNYDVNGADNVIIRNNIVHHTGDDGLKIGHANHIYMLNNEIYRAGLAGTQQGIDMVGVYDSVVCGNYIHDETNAAWGARSMNKGIFDKGGSQNILIENNIITDIESPEACLEVGGDTEWYNTRYEPELVNNFSSTDSITNINTQILSADASNNAIDSASAYIASLMSESRYAIVRGNLLVNCDPGLSFRNTYGARVYNNTVINSGWSQRWVKIWDDGNEPHINVNLRLYNNLMYNDGSVGLASNSAINNRYDMSLGGGFVFESNLLNNNNNTAVPALGVSISFADPADQLTGNPLLSGVLYQPLAGSAAINTGANLTSLGIVSGTFTDSLGVSRPAGGAFDIGAFEYNE